MQFDKHGWHYCNRLKDTAGQAQWLTVPVRHTNLNQPRILDIEVEPRSPWARNHIGTIRPWTGVSSPRSMRISAA
jgi:hypothetical protein